MFLRALRADGINPSDLMSLPAEGMELESVKLDELENYIEVVSQRVMKAYDFSENGVLSRDEFMALADLVEKEYTRGGHKPYEGENVVGRWRIGRTLGRGSVGVVRLRLCCAHLFD